jgi:hypothetical protein
MNCYAPLLPNPQACRSGPCLPKDGRDIGELWEEPTGGRCLFVMVTDKDWKVITEKTG